MAFRILDSTLKRENLIKKITMRIKKSEFSKGIQFCMLT